MPDLPIIRTFGYFFVVSNQPPLPPPVQEGNVNARQQPFITFVSLFLLVASLWAIPAHAQVDTTSAIQINPLEDHSPKGALWRGAVVPGWGQYYNKQYLKIPVVYVGLGGLTGAALYTNSRYLLYRHAFLFTAREDTSGSPVFPQFADDYEQLISELGLPPESSLTPEEIASRRARLEPGFRSQRDSLRRNRDLLYIGIGLWYGLSLLDAYVSAHMLDFDVSEDLSVTIFPHPDASGLTARVRF